MKKLINESQFTPRLSRLRWIKINELIQKTGLLNPER